MAKLLRQLTLILIFTLGGLSLVSCAESASQPNKDSANSEDLSSSATQEPNQIEDEALEDGQDSKLEASTTTSGFYIPLETYEADKSKYTNQRVILFFNAAWCSTCKVARDNFEASKADIPSDMTIVIVDYDDSDALRTKYGVTLQHTFVQVDANGAALAKWSGSTTISELEDQTS